MSDRTPHERSLRRSHVRARILCILVTRGQTHANHLSDLAGVDARRLRWAMFGDGDRYRHDLGLVPLGLVEQRRRGGATSYAATREGRRIARQLMRERRIRNWS